MGGSSEGSERINPVVLNKGEVRGEEKSRGEERRNREIKNK